MGIHTICSSVFAEADNAVYVSEFLVPMTLLLSHNDTWAMSSTPYAVGESSKPFDPDPGTGLIDKDPMSIAPESIALCDRSSIASKFRVHNSI